MAGYLEESLRWRWKTIKEILFFWGPHCPKCKDARKLIGWHRGVKVTRHNVEKSEGLAEAAWYGVSSTPSIVVAEDKGYARVVIAKFHPDTLPTREELKELLK